MALSGKRAFSPQRLSALLPETIGDWKRTGMVSPSPEPHEAAPPVLRATYARGKDDVELEFSDLGAAGAAAARSTKAGPDVGKVHASRGHVVREAQDGGLGSASVELKNGLHLRVAGQGVDAATLRALVDAIDLDAAAALPRLRT